MSGPSLPLIRLDFYKVLLLQSAVVVIVFLILWAAKGFSVAASFLLGGLICILPSAWLMRRLFAKWGKAPKRLLRTFLVGETVKLLLITLFFIIVLHWSFITPFSLLAGFIVAQFAIWLAPLVFTRSLKVAT